MTVGYAPIGCTASHAISVPRGYTVSVGLSPATGSAYAYQFAHIVAAVSRWNGSTWGPSVTWDLPNSTALPGAYTNYGNQTPFSLSGVSIGPFSAGYYRVGFRVDWYTGSGGYLGSRVIDANGYDYQQGSSTQAWCRF